MVFRSKNSVAGIFKLTMGAHVRLGMGTYRLLLAVLVALSHMSVSVLGHNQGVVAVISFFLLSGSMMTALVRKYYTGPADVVDFYRDRAARLLPQFLGFFVLSAVLILGLHIDAPPLVGLKPMSWLLSLLILPQGFYMYWPMFFGLTPALPMPQCWSLGLEIFFYIAIPWIIIFRRSVLLPLIVLSVVVAAAAYVGGLNTDVFGYRLLPGTLYMFLVGASFQIPIETPTGRRLAWVRSGVLVAALALAGLAIAEPTFGNLHYNSEVYLGLAIGMVVLTWLHRQPTNRLDTLLGNLSYGVFLDHNIVAWTYERLTGHVTLGVVDLVIVLGIAVGLAWLSFVLLERPALRWRHALRRRHQGAAQQRIAAVSAE